MRYSKNKVKSYLVHVLKIVFLKKILTNTAFLILLILSCTNEEEVELPRDVSEQSIADDQLLEDFLSTHYYNYEAFDNSDRYPEIIFDTLSGANASKTPLISQVEKKIIRVKTSDGSFVNHNLYYLIAREGIGKSPASVDSTFQSYEGSLLNGNVFDSNQNSIWFDLTQVVRGFREGMPNFKAGTYDVNEDNSITFKDYGQGAVFMPSWLGYFSRAAGAIPSYSPLIFKINLYTVKQTDHDGDGIPSSEEFDNDGDGIADDTDCDGTPDYLDKS